MGTDIHGKFQRLDKESGKWFDIQTEYEFDRHYQLFAVLANVRNGRGFAGDITGDVVEPISEPRGLPKDYDNGVDEFIGEHSFSYLYAKEMLDWYAKDLNVTHIGILDRETFERWDGVSTPDSYCSGVCGNGIIVINNTEEEKKSKGWNYIRCKWNVSLKNELAYFFDEVKRLSDIHGEIRFVFGFDS